jgi:hypothetical protein
MSINTTQLIEIILGKTDIGDPVIEFPDTEVSLFGVEREVEVEVTIGHYSDTVDITHELCGEEEITIELTLSRVLEVVIEEECSGEALGVLLSALDEEECLQVVHAIAAGRMTLCGPGPEKRKWERVHTAVTMMEPEPEPTTADTEIDEKFMRIIEVEVPVTEEALDHAPTVKSAPVPDTETVSSNVKETVKSILSVEDDRLLLIGLLVEAGYAVGKKVS